MIFMGIDPGKEGAFVSINEGGAICHLEIMPLGPDKQPSYEGVKLFLSGLKDMKPEVFLERAVSFGMGGLSAFNYGRGFAAIEIALQDLEMPYTMVEPRKWTKSIFQGIDADLKPKAQSLMAIDRLFPGEKKKIPVSPKAKNMHEGIVDALLIAEFGRRQKMLHS